MEITETYYATDRATLRKWFENNAHELTEIWLIYYKLSSGKTGVNYQDSVKEALCFGWIDGIKKKLDGERYVLRFTPRKPKSIWSQVNKECAKILIREGLMTEAGLKAIEHAKKSGEWDKAYRLSGETPLPDDLKLALEMNPLAFANFNGLSNSNKFMYVRQVDKIKGKALREERINKVISLLENNIKPYIDGKPSIMK